MISTIEPNVAFSTAPTAKLLCADILKKGMNYGIAKQHLIYGINYQLGAKTMLIEQ